MTGRLFIGILILVLLAAACGLKGPPIPPAAKGQAGARSGSGALQFGPKEQKGEPEEERILRLYGLGRKPKPHLPGAEEAFGIGSPEDESKKWMESDEMNPNWLPAPPPETEKPPPSPTDDDTEKQEKDEAAP